MRSAMKWTLPILAAVALLVGWSVESANAQATTGKITGTVKQADGQPAVGAVVSLFKGDVQFPARGGRRGGGAGGPGGAGGAPGGQAVAPTPPPTSMPAAVATATADDKGVYNFADVEPGEYTVMVGAGGARGARGPGAAAPGGGRGMGRGRATGTVKAGETLTIDITLQAGRGGRGGAGGAGGGGRRGGGAGGAGGAAPGQGA